MSVYAFQPRTYDPPKFVAEDSEELGELAGDLLYSCQCDSCGNSCYRVERRFTRHGTPLAAFSAVCVTDPDKDPEDVWEGCGKGYPISIWDEDLVEF